MPFAKLFIIQSGHASREFDVESDLVTIGRALDNSVALEHDSNVSRYHAEIERRGDTFWLVDLGSSNGSTVNDQPLQLEQQLDNGDLICLGGSTTIEFRVSDFPLDQQEAPQQEEIVEAPQSNATQATPVISNAVGNVAAGSSNIVPQVPAVTAPSTGLSAIYIAGAVLGGLFITGIVGAVLFFRSGPACKAVVRIVSPQSGTTVKGPIPIRVEAEETECVDRLIYQIDGVKVASSEVAPYQATLDPTDISGLSPGNHVLTVVVEDNEGNREVQPDEVVLGFEAAPDSSSDNSGDSGVPPPGENDRTVDNQTQSLSTVEIKQMCERLLRELSKREYVLDRALLHQIQTSTADYAIPGFYNRARPFRDVINDSFVNEQGLEKPLGYILAMSRSNFDLSKSRSPGRMEGEGLWRVPLTLAQNAGYLGRCGTATLSDQNQKCAAMVAAAYMKALEVDLFGGDPLYAVASFGMAPNDAAQWRDQLPADRRDLWNVIKSAEQRDRVARFFAAGIVTENPTRFGLTIDSPLSNLYPK